jgi:predicted PurR-regulated permease PerM
MPREKPRQAAHSGHASSVPPGAVVPPSRAVATRVGPGHLYKAIGLSLLAALVYRFFDDFSRAFLLVYGAAILAVALNIIVGLFPSQRRWITAGLGLLLIGALAVALWIGVPALADQLRAIVDRGPEFERKLQQWSAWLSDRTGLSIALNGGHTADYVRRAFGGGEEGDVIGRARGLVEIVILPLLVLVGSLYAVGKPNDRLLTPLLRAVPRDRRLAFRRLLELLGIRLRGWIAGTLFSMLAVGVLTTVALYLVGARYALLLGTLNGVLEFIPIVGPWAGGAVAVLVTFLDSPSLALGVLLIVVAVQQLESNLITPLVMEKIAEVHPFITVFAIFLFGALFGFLGILLALPMVLLIWTTIEVLWVERAIDTDEDPIQPVVHE